MAKKQKTRKGSKKLRAACIFFVRHKTALLLVFLSMLAVAGVFGYVSMQESNKFSKADFDSLTTKAESVLKQTSGKEVIVKRTCSYERPGEFDSLHLYCRVAMVVYLPYVSANNAIGIAKDLEKKIRQEFGGETFQFSSFYKKPYVGTDTATITLTRPKHEQCNFGIDTNKNAERVLDFPEQGDNNLIALSFYCAAESGGEYFPVTYRQG